MKADDFYEKDYVELMDALRIAYKGDIVPYDVKESIKDFFKGNQEIEYNDFLKMFNEKYGNIVNQYREKQKLKSIRYIRFASNIYVVTFFLAIALIFIGLLLNIFE